MGRRSALYVVNFMLPVLFFLGLDLASFLISDSGGEKLGFKVTVLLSVTVMQLILSEILPSTSNRIPLIGKEAQSHCTSYEQEQHTLCSYLSTLMMMSSPFSDLHYGDFWIDDAQPPGDDFSDESVGERLERK